MSIIIDPLENMFDSMGMMEGASAPLKRAAFGAAVGYGITYTWHPAVAFDEGGKPRPWKATDPDAPDATWVPAWMLVILPAVIFSVAI